MFDALQCYHPCHTSLATSPTYHPTAISSRRNVNLIDALDGYWPVMEIRLSVCEIIYRVEFLSFLASPCNAIQLELRWYLCSLLMSYFLLRDTMTDSKMRWKWQLSFSPSPSNFSTDEYVPEMMFRFGATYFYAAVLSSCVLLTSLSRENIPKAVKLREPFAPLLSNHRAIR